MNKDYKQDANPMPAPPYYYPTNTYPLDDEINLVDLWRVLAKRRKLILTIFLLVTFLGCIYGLLKAETYRYSTAIQIGSFFVDGKKDLVDKVKNVENEVKEIYITSVLGIFYRNNPDQDKNIKIDVSLPKDSDELLVISGKCSEKQKDIYHDLINKIGNKIVVDHHNEIERYRSWLTAKIANAKKRLNFLNQNEKELTDRVGGFDKTFKKTPIDNSGTTVLVMTELSQQQQAISREKFTLEALISEKETELNLIKETKLLYPVAKSLEPVGTDKKFIIFASLVLGLILGVFIAFAWDAIEKMKDKLATG